MLKINRFTKFAYIMSLIAVLSIGDVVYASNVTAIDNADFEGELVTDDFENSVIANPGNSTQDHQDNISNKIPDREIYISKEGSFILVNGKLEPLTEANISGQYIAIGNVKDYDVPAHRDVNNENRNINIPAPTTYIKNNGKLISVNSVDQSQYMLSGPNERIDGKTYNIWIPADPKSLQPVVYVEVKKGMVGYSSSSYTPRNQYNSFADNVDHKTITVRKDGVDYKIIQGSNSSDVLTSNSIAYSTREAEEQKLRDHFKGYQVAVIPEDQKPKIKTITVNVNDLGSNNKILESLVSESKSTKSKNSDVTALVPYNPANGQNSVTSAGSSVTNIVPNKVSTQQISIATQNPVPTPVPGTSPAPEKPKTYNPYTQAEMDAGERSANEVIANKNAERLNKLAKEKSRVMLGGERDKNAPQIPVYILSNNGILQTAASSDLSNYKEDGFKRINGETYVKFIDLHGKSQPKYVPMEKPMGSQVAVIPGEGVKTHKETVKIPNIKSMPMEKPMGSQVAVIPGEGVKTHFITTLKEKKMNPKTSALISNPVVQHQNSILSAKSLMNKVQEIKFKSNNTGSTSIYVTQSRMRVIDIESSNSALGK